MIWAKFSGFLQAEHGGQFMKDGDKAESTSVEADAEAPASCEDHVLILVDLRPPPQAHDAVTIVSNTPSMFDNKKAQAEVCIEKVSVHN